MCLCIHIRRAELTLKLMGINKVLITQRHSHLTVEKTLPPIQGAIFQPKHNISPSPTEGMQTENACIVFQMFCVYTGRKVGTELKRRKNNYRAI